MRNDPKTRFSSAKESERLQDFSARYSVERTDVLIGMERAVIGGDWGANGFTTMAQADDLVARLDLRRDDRLLDVGSGRGWPGLYISKRSGCEVVLTDLPIEGLRSARPRAEAERVSLTGAVVCSAKYLPFAPRTFDAVVHTDVLC